MDRLRITLLGAFQMSRGDVALPVPGARLQGLVVRLALAGGRAVEQSALIDAIWAEDPPADPAHALQALVSRLRRTLGSADDVTQVSGGYRLAVDAADVDALRFEQLAATGRDRLRAGDVTAAAAVLGEAVALWGDHGPAAVAAVAPAVATRLAEVATEAVADLADAELALGRADTAADRLTALLAEHPVHERAAASLMDALAAQGRQAEALARYERIRETLAEELGTDPGAALRERHLRLLRAEQPAARPRPSALPAPLTSFIGRDDDLARIETLLETGRLVTVLGPGGAGKTRLAIEAARRHERAWLIDLASVTEPAKVGAALLAAIGLRGSALFEAGLRDDQDELDVLTDQLDGRETLLVMDNCEHLIDAVAHLLSALLTRCAGLRVLATSREPLAIDGEALVPLGPLPLPEPDADAAEASRTASVRLFTERAASVRPGFAVDEHNLTEVLTIVRGLDGMPLALELAAARLRTLSLTDLAAGLSDRFRLLTTGSRTALPRHRTLHAVIEWSWDLLEADARTVAERISVLPGGITTASATAVCAGIAGVPELLAGLVDRSLLQLAPDTGRYRMLETIREYGLRNLTEQGALADARDRAAGYFAELVARCDPLLRGPEQLDALQILRAEYDNILAALRRRCETGDGAIALAVDLTWYWQMLGRRGDATYWFGEALASPSPPGVERDIAEWLLRTTAATQSALVNDWINERDDDLRALIGRLMAYPELPGFGGALTTLRLAFVRETETWLTIVQDVIDGPDVWLAGLALMFRAHFAENSGRLTEAHEDATAALDHFARAGDRWGQATALPLRAMLRQSGGDLDGAFADLTETSRLAREFWSLSRTDELFIDLRWIDLYVRLGEPARAADLITATRDRAQHPASPEITMLLDVREASLRLHTGDLTGARKLIDSAEAGLGTRLPFDDDHGRALVESLRATLHIGLGDAEGASRAVKRAYAAAVASLDMPVLAVVAVSVAGLAALHDRYADMAVILGAAARLRGAHDRTEPRIRDLTRRGHSVLGEENFAVAYDKGWQLDGAAVRAAIMEYDWLT
ncbi:Predicted ATPase [Amycolatopsis xylanica]|uniref:Predicted ATPase n=1 Tax=Amycolatopsis xylanica TaxID=589385 RepID=A0A1H2W5P9_9PSEU|nr:BTAD domain-containing putative transcriptional regulator [Amycolatopsis xylanica]SDW75861.1 Predicted ATPase [Amycolatopsis xylanica]